MGEITEDMLDGSMCSGCGCYFKHPQGHGIYVHEYPCLCEDCYNEGDELPLAEAQTF